MSWFRVEIEVEADEVPKDPADLIRWLVTPGLRFDSVSAYRITPEGEIDLGKTPEFAIEEARRQARYGDWKPS